MSERLLLLITVQSSCSGMNVDRYLNISRLPADDPLSLDGYISLSDYSVTLIAFVFSVSILVNLRFCVKFYFTEVSFFLLFRIIRFNSVK